MAQHTQLMHTLSFEADAAIAKYQVVKFGTSDQHADVAGANESPIGIALTSASAAGECIDVLVFGFVDGVASAAIAAGDLVGAAANGQLQTITPGATTGTLRALGRAWETASASGDRISVFVNAANPFAAV
ncbi:MAG: capsid cement protein [Myxococcota bacterium]